MTTYRIVCAGCNEEIIKKFSIVSELFKARDKYLTVNFEPWDGTRAKLVISNIDDAYGLNVARLAHQRGMALFILGSSMGSVPDDLKSVATHAFLPDNSPISLMFKQFSLYFGTLENRLKLRAEDSTLILFNNLLKEDNRIYLTYNSHTVFHHVENGMCIADSQETLECVQKAIADKTPISLSEVAPHNFNPQISISVEDFYFHAFEGVDDMPSLPGNLIKLNSWPDIKSEINPHKIVGLSSVITQEFRSVNQLIEEHSEIAKPYFMATALARLLSYREKTPMDPPEDQRAIPVEKPGIIKKLSLWLGLK